MVTNPAALEPEPTKAERVEEAARSVIAGHPQGAVRRIGLYVILAATGLGGIVIDGGVGLILGGVALIALMLLAMTDQLA